MDYERVLSNSDAAPQLVTTKLPTLFWCVGAVALLLVAIYALALHPETDAPTFVSSLVLP